MRLRTYAKINLYLKIVGRRPDGYHDVDTIYHSVSLADEIEVTQRPTAPGLMFSVSGVRAEPDDLLRFQSDNLVTRAAALLEKRAGAKIRAKVRLHKQIPIGAGLAGGSANAAGTLVALNQLLDLKCTADDLLAIAIELGSDVPFGLVGGTARGIGRGEILAPAADPPDLWFVLGISHDPLMTGEVYDKWNEVGDSAAGDSGNLIEALEDGVIEGIWQAMHNDLASAAVALRPELEENLETMTSRGALGAIVCGSGPTVLGLARDLAHARDVAREVSGAFDRVEVVHSVPAGIERLD